MRQVPQYLLIGNGRVARHFRHYFSLLKLPFMAWDRSASLSDLHQKVTACSHLLLLISDSAIDEFINQHLEKSEAIRIHFSGSLILSNAFGAHPLMTFSENLYDVEQYHAFSFVLDHDAPPFETLLPGIPNRHVRLDTSLKAKYHALCVLSGNFSCLLWQKFFTSLQQEFNLSSSIAHPYLMQQTKNLITNAKSALTGPLVRDDRKTIEKNLAALSSDPYQEIYKSFVAAYFEEPMQSTNKDEENRHEYF
jgi:predicted short-subunit dehydrogenase-like oxidoreductase (DUF2520 family)